MVELIIFVSAVLAGLVNAVAGSGTLVAFPALVYIGIEPVSATITNIVSLWVGLLASTFSFKEKLLDEEVKKHIPVLLIPAILGASIGAFLLNITPSKIFQDVVPYLILASVFLLAFGDRIKLEIKTISKVRLIIVVLLQLIIGIYGGYFGAGIGIMLLAVVNIYGIGDLYYVNGVKNFLGLSINFVAALSFLLVSEDRIVWNIVPILISGYIVGGYTGGIVAQKVSSGKLKIIIIIWGLTVTKILGSELP